MLQSFLRLIKLNFTRAFLPHSKVARAQSLSPIRCCPQEELVEFCREKGIVVTAYSPLASDNAPILLTNEVVVKIAEKYGVHPAQILISLQANRPGVNVLTKSVTPARIEGVCKMLTFSESAEYVVFIANFKTIDLTEADIRELHDIDKTFHFRACHPDWTGWGSLGFPDCEEQ